MPGKTKISDLEVAGVADEQVGCLHISMQDMLIVEVTEALQKLQHVAFDLALFEMD